VKFIVRRAGNTPYDVQAMSDRSRVAVHIGDVLFVTYELGRRPRAAESS